MKKNKIDTPYRMSPYSWDHITGEKYWEIYDILYDDTLTDMDKQARLCCAIEDIDLNDFYNLPVNEATRKIAQLDFLNEFKLRKNYKPNYIKLGEYKCKVVNAEEMCVAAFIDYQNFITLPFRDNYDKILSIFLVPDGQKYNDGYDIKEIQRLIRENMLWIDIQSLLNFILIGYIKSLYLSLRYSIKMVKKLKGRERQEMEKMTVELRKKIDSLMDFHISAS